MAIMNREVSQLAGFSDVKKKKVPRRFSGLNEQQSHQRKGQQIPEIMSHSLAALAPAHSIWHTGSRTFSQHLLTFHPCLSSEWVIVYLALLYRAFPSSTCAHTHTNTHILIYSWRDDLCITRWLRRQSLMYFYVRVFTGSRPEYSDTNCPSKIRNSTNFRDFELNFWVL